MKSDEEKLDKAIAFFSRMIELYPRNPKMYNSLGDAHYKKGNVEEAIKVYKKALELDPDNTEFRKNLEKAQNDKDAKNRATEEEENLDKSFPRPNVFRIVGGTGVENQSLTQSEKARAAIALTKLRRAQEELKNIAEVTTDVTLLYDLWSGKTGLEPSIFTEQIRAIFSFIPEGSAVRFNKKTNSAGTKYLTVKWESDNEIDKGEITLGTYQEDGTLVWSDPSTWVQREKQKNKQGYIQNK